MRGRRRERRVVAFHDLFECTERRVVAFRDPRRRVGHETRQLDSDIRREATKRGNSILDLVRSAKGQGSAAAFETAGWLISFRFWVWLPTEHAHVRRLDLDVLVGGEGERLVDGRQAFIYAPSGQVPLAYNALKRVGSRSLPRRLQVGQLGVQTGNLGLYAGYGGVHRLCCRCDSVAVYAKDGHGVLLVVGVEL